MRPPGNIRWNVAAPAIVGALALVIAGYLAWLTFQHDPAAQPAKAAPAVTTHTLVNRSGGYSVQVPAGMQATRSGTSTHIRDKGRTLAVTITPTPRGTPASNNTSVLRTMVSTYRSVRLTANEQRRIDGRAALASYGQAVTKKGVALRFLLITITGKSQNFAISTFAAANSDPQKVLPIIRAIANGFHVLPARKAAKK